MKLDFDLGNVMVTEFGVGRCHRSRNTPHFGSVKFPHPPDPRRDRDEF
jgi:hypothetical protein